jgi:hypothetical protein
MSPRTSIPSPQLANSDPLPLSNLAGKIHIRCSSTRR